LKLSYCATPKLSDWHAATCIDQYKRDLEVASHQPARVLRTK